MEKTFTKKELIGVLKELADSCDSSVIDGKLTGDRLHDYYWKCGNANAVNFIISQFGLGDEKILVQKGDMDKLDKPRLAEMLGVEEDEVWTYPGLIGPYRVHDGIRQYKVRKGNWCNCANEVDLAEIINHPESIIRVPSLTEPELAICRAMGAKWVSRDDDVRSVELWREKPRKTNSGIYVGEQSGSRIAMVNPSLFPSVEPGDCIEVEGT